MSSSRSRISNRLEKLYAQVASKVLKDSIHLNKGESITIETWNNGQAFAQKLALEARKIGAIPLVVFEDEQAYVQGVKVTENESRGKMGKHEYALLSGTDAYVFIPGPPLSSFYSGLTNEERTSSVAYNTAWYEAAMKAKLRGARLSFGYVGKELARVLGKTQDKIVEHQLKAALDSDFSLISSTGKQMAQYLQDGANCTVTSNGSKLEFKMQGDLEVEDGIVDEIDVSEGGNMTYVPPGFVLKRIDSPSVSGKIKGFSAATPFGVIKDGILEFESGNLVRWESKSSKKVLDKAIESISEDTRKLVAMSIGLNPKAKLGYNLDRFVNGAVSLNVTSRLGAVLQNANVSVNGKEIVSSGKVVTA